MYQWIKNRIEILTDKIKGGSPSHPLKSKGNIHILPKRYSYILLCNANDPNEPTHIMGCMKLDIKISKEQWLGQVEIKTVIDIYTNCILTEPFKPIEAKYVFVIEGTDGNSEKEVVAGCEIHEQKEWSAFSVDDLIIGNRRWRGMFIDKWNGITVDTSNYFGKLDSSNTFKMESK